MNPRTRALWLFAPVVLTLIALGCEDGPGRAPGTAPPPPPPPSTAAASAVGEGAAPGSTGPEAGAPDAGNPPRALEGRWEGNFEAKKAVIELPPKVKDKVRSTDEGKLAAGKGKLVLTVGEGGVVKGSADGALGALSITGRVEETVLRASVFADDPHADLAMAGVLVGVVRDDVIAAELRVAGPDAMLVREAIFELRRP